MNQKSNFLAHEVFYQKVSWHPIPPFSLLKSYTCAFLSEIGERGGGALTKLSFRKEMPFNDERWKFLHL